MIQLRTIKDISVKIIELKSLYSSKELALVAVDEQIERLLKIRQFRYNAEEDIETLKNISLYRALRLALSGVPEWAIPEKPKFKISNLFQPAIKYLVNLLSNTRGVKNPDTQLDLRSTHDREITKLIEKRKLLEESIKMGSTTSLEAEAIRSSIEEAARRRAIDKRLALEAKLKAQEEANRLAYEESLTTSEEIEIAEVVEEPMGPSIEMTIIKSLWKLDGTVEDSLNNLHGSIVTPTDYGAVPSTIDFGQDDQGNQYFQSDGISFISLPNNSLNFNDDFSVSFNLYVPSSVGTKGITILSSFDNSAAYDEYHGWYINYSNNIINIGMAMTYADSPNFTFAEMSLKDQWVNVIITRKRSVRTTIYINGVKSADSYIADDPVYSNNNLAYIGASYYSLSVPRYGVNSEGFKINSIETWDGYELLQEDIDERYLVDKPSGRFKNIFK